MIEDIILKTKSNSFNQLVVKDNNDYKNLVINLKHRIDRWKHTLIEFEKLGLIANRFDAIKNQDGRIGCTMSHIKCLEYAIENDLDYILISEDDITFLNPVLLENSLKNY